MATTKAQQKATIKYMRSHYDEIITRVVKGQKEEIKAHAEKNGESLNAFVKRAISETIERDNEKNK